jgi:hypothetical protein
MEVYFIQFFQQFIGDICRFQIRKIKVFTFFPANFEKEIFLLTFQDSEQNQPEFLRQ